MKRVDLLCSMNREMLEVFSEHTVQNLKVMPLFRLALPPLQALLVANVDKEIEKDRRIITHAASLQRLGDEPGPEHVDSLLQQAREIDQAFLRKAAIVPVNIQIQYQDIELYRQRRTEMLLEASYRIFRQWQAMGSLRRVLLQLYDRTQFQQLLQDILQLYAMETHMLSTSVRLPFPLTRLRESITRSITQVMEQEAQLLSSSLAKRMFQRNP